MTAAQTVASAPAKTILFGEHTVVYGQPAIAIPVAGLRAYAEATPGNGGLRIIAADLEIPVDVDSETVDHALALTARLVLRELKASPPDAIINIRSDIPIASGLGSGAAVSTALARALYGVLERTIPEADLNDLIYEVEKIHHGTPSGIDNTVIVYERPVYFVRNQPLETLTIGQPFTLLIADTGKSASTRDAVSGVRTLYESDPLRIQPMLDAVGAIARQARTAIESGQPESLGGLMQQNHDLLRDLTVSSPELDTLVAAAYDAGASGAKLSGGGRGGNMIALVTPETRQKVEAALLDAGATHVYTTEVS